MSEQTGNVILLLVCLVITLASWVFVISYNTGHILDADEWMWWLFWQYIFLFMVLWCFLWCLKKFSVQKDQNEVYAYIYFSHLFLFVTFKILIENIETAKWKENFHVHPDLEEACWMFLVASPLLVIISTICCVIISKLRKCLLKTRCCSTRSNRQVRRGRLMRTKITRFWRGIKRMFVRTVQPSEEDNCNVEAEQVEAEETELALILDQPPPDYEDILLADLPNYESLNIKHFVLGRKVFIIDKSFHMTSFHVSDQI